MLCLNIYIYINIYKLIFFAGGYPLNNMGNVRLKISPESARAVKLIPKIESWNIPPTMTRGSGRAAGAVGGGTGAGDQAKAKATKTKKFVRRGRKKNKKAHGKSKESDSKPSQSEKASTGKIGLKRKVKDLVQQKKGECLMVDIPTSKDYRRTKKGFQVMRHVITELYEPDKKAFPMSPAFDDKGFCRLRNEACQNTTWEQIRSVTPDALDALHLVLSCCSVMNIYLYIFVYGSVIL